MVPLRVSALVATLGDGHTRVPLPQPAYPAAQLPLDWYLFEEGLYVVRAPRRYGKLAGSRVVAIGGIAVEEAVAAAARLVSAENDSWRRSEVPRYLLRGRHRVIGAGAARAMPMRLDAGRARRARGVPFRPR